MITVAMNASTHPDHNSAEALTTIAPVTAMATESNAKTPAHAVATPTAARPAMPVNVKFTLFRHQLWLGVWSLIPCSGWFSVMRQSMVL